MSERSERDTLRSVQLKIGDIYILVRAISVNSASVPYAACFTAAVKISLFLIGYISVLEFVLIERYLKAISSNYGLNKVY